MFTNYKRGNCCPICGKSNDYCGYQIRNGDIWIGCHVELSYRPGACLIGQDGAEYRMMYLKNHVALFQPQQQYEDFLAKKNEVVPSADKCQTTKPSNSNSLQDVISHSASSEQMDYAYRKVLSKLQLSEKHKQELLNDFWTERLIEQAKTYVYSYLPVLDLNDLSIQSVAGIPGFYGKNQVRLYPEIPGMLFPVYNQMGKIIGLRLKPDWSEGQKKQAAMQQRKLPKYLWFSSFKKNNNNENVLENGTKCIPRVGWYFDTMDSWNSVIITEGEKKGFIANQLLSVPTLSLPGVSQYNSLITKQECGQTILEILKEKGVKKILVGEDMDLFQKKSVKQAFNALIDLLIRYDFELFYLVWDKNIGKGLDDFLLRSGKKPFIVPVTK